MKIAFLNFYQGHIDRGAETFVYELATHLAKKNKVYIFQAGPINKKYSVKQIQKKVYLPKIWPDDNLPDTHILKRVFFHYYKRKELIFTLKCLKGLNKFKPDIIVPLNSGWQALIMSIFSRLNQAKLVIAGQSGPGWDDRWNLLVKPHAFVTLTSFQKNWAKKATLWHNHRIVKIPNGINLEKFKPAGKKKKFSLQKPIILLVGATIPSKRVGEGIKAVANLKQGSLLVIGQGALAKRTDNLGYKLLGKPRYLRLSVPYPQMPQVYRSADLFTLCSAASEAFGIAYLEALASGLACVATDDSSRREIIGSAGVFVKDPVNSKQYSKALTKALKTDWGQKPINQAKLFTWDQIALKYQQLFSDLLKS